MMTAWRTTALWQNRCAHASIINVVQRDPVILVVDLSPCSGCAAVPAARCGADYVAYVNNGLRAEFVKETAACLICVPLLLI